MLPLLFVFLAIFSVAFVTLAVVLRSSREQQLLERRFRALLPSLGMYDKDVRAEAFLADSIGGKRLNDSSHTGFPPLHLLEQLIYQARGTRSIRSTVLLMTAGAIVGFSAVLLLTGMLPIAVLAASLLATAPVLWLARLRQQRLKAFQAALPESIDMCARALRAGYSLVAAIGIVAEQAAEPARSEFADVFRKQNYGVPVRDAFMEVLERVPSPDLRVFVTGILVQKDTGGNLTEIFDRIVYVIRERIRIQGEIRVHTAQGRLTAWILTLLPGALLLIVNLIDPGYSRPMFQEPLGRKLMYLGTGLQLVGGLVVRRIVNGIEV